MLGSLVTVRGLVERVIASVEADVSAAVLDRLAGPEDLAEDDTGRFRRIMRRVFGLGLDPWILGRHWVATLAALEDGVPWRIAALDDVAAARYLATPGVLRNARKLAAVRHNAAVVVGLAETFGDLAAYAAAVAADGPEALASDLRRRFRLLGPLGAARVAQELGVDVMPPHPAVLRVLERLGALTDPDDAAEVQRIAGALAPPGPSPFPRGRLGAVLLAFATGRWSRRVVCADDPRCEACPVADACPSCVVRTAPRPAEGDGGCVSDAAAEGPAGGDDAAEGEVAVA